MRKEKIFKNPVLFAVIGTLGIILILIFTVFFRKVTPATHEAYPIALETLEKLTNYKANPEYYYLSAENRKSYKESREKSCEAALENLSIDECPILKEENDQDLSMAAKENKSSVKITGIKESSKNKVTFLAKIKTSKTYIDQCAKDDSWDQRTLTKNIITTAFEDVPVSMIKDGDKWIINNITEINKKLGDSISTWNLERVEGSPSVTDTKREEFDDGGEYIRRREKGEN